MIAATVVHFGVLALWPELTPADIALDHTVMTTIEVPPDIKLPDAPTELQHPARPVVAKVDVPDDMTIARTTLDANPASTLPPPPDAPASTRSATPTFTPYTVRPEILNREEVRAALARLYPSSLKDAGIGGTVELTIYVDESGTVRDARIQQGSGHTRLDEAALALTDVLRFSPALNRDKKVGVWVAFPVVFEIRR